MINIKPKIYPFSSKSKTLANKIFDKLQQQICLVYT